MYGIPNMKLEKTVVERRTDLMSAEGVQFVTEHMSSRLFCRQTDAGV